MARQNALDLGAKHSHSAGYGEHLLSTNRGVLACKAGMDERFSASQSLRKRGPSPIRERAFFVALTDCSRRAASQPTPNQALGSLVAMLR